MLYNKNDKKRQTKPSGGSSGDYINIGGFNRYGDISDRVSAAGERSGIYERNRSGKSTLPRRQGSIRVVENRKRTTGTKRQRKKTNARGSKSRKGRPIIIAVCGIAVFIVIFFMIALSTIKQDRIMNNVYIEGMNVGGLTYEETLAAVNASSLFQDSELTLTDGKTEFTINGADIGLSALPEQTVEKAMNYCKEGGIVSRALSAVMLMFRPHVIVPAPQVDEEKLAEKLDECGNLMVGERQEHHFELTKDLVATFYPGTTGYDGDSSIARAQIADALSKEKFKNIHVDFKTAPPQDLTVEKAGEMIYAEPEDAHYEYSGNDVTVVPDKNGRKIDEKAAASLVGQVREGGGPVDIPYTASYAEVTAKTLRDKLFADTLSTYATYYSGSTENRSMNVERAAKLISGTVVPPGNIFSFNDTVGRRTKENGFYTAKEYMDGKSVDGIGGGVCQVSSTLYSAVLYADMEIVERFNHSMTVGYIPLGQDATVTDGGMDFQFENTSDYPIKISAYTNGTNIIVTILGTSWNPPRSVEIINNETESDSGDKIMVTSKRKVYANGELLTTDTLNSSTYAP